MFNFWKIIKCWRRIRVFLSRIPGLSFLYSDKGKTEHFLFNLTAPITAQEFYDKVVTLWYQYDPFATQYKGQVFSARKLDGHMQYHIRFYNDGAVSGHHEHNYEFDMKGHMKGEGCQTMNGSEYTEEYNKLKAALGIP